MRKLNKYLFLLCIVGMGALSLKNWTDFINGSPDSLLPAVLFSLMTVVGIAVYKSEKW